MYITYFMCIPYLENSCCITYIPDFMLFAYVNALGAFNILYSKCGLTF